MNSHFNIPISKEHANALYKDQPKYTFDTARVSVHGSELDTRAVTMPPGREGDHYKYFTTPQYINTLGGNHV